MKNSKAVAVVIIVIRKALVSTYTSDGVVRGSFITEVYTARSTSQFLNETRII